MVPPFGKPGFPFGKQGPPFGQPGLSFGKQVPPFGKPGPPFGRPTMTLFCLDFWRFEVKNDNSASNIIRHKVDIRR